MKILFLEIATIVGSLNAILYIGGFFRKLENKRQEEASKQNRKIAILEGQVDAIINSSYYSSNSEKSFEDIFLSNEENILVEED